MIATYARKQCNHVAREDTSLKRGRGSEGATGKKTASRLSSSDILSAKRSLISTKTPDLTLSTSRWGNGCDAGERANPPVNWGGSEGAVGCNSHGVEMGPTADETTATDVREEAAGTVPRIQLEAEGATPRVQPVE
jgi:hypothetical protein